MYVGIQRLSETNAKKNWQTRLRESERRSNFVWVHKAEWWEWVWSSRPRETNPIYVCWYRLSETNTKKKWETRLRESEPRSKFVWVHKAEWWESVWSSRPRETNCKCMLVSRGWAKRAAKKLTNQAEGKWTQVKFCLGPEGWVMRVSLVEQAKRNES